MQSAETRVERLIGPLKAVLRDVMKGGETAEIHVTATATGIDLSLSLKRRYGPEILTALADCAARLKLARLTWNGELVAMTAPPSLSISGHTVRLPPEAFLQATEDGRRILQTLARENIGEAKNVADLFSGIGTFAFVLAADRAVHAVDSACATIAALKNAAIGRTRHHR